ncbi:MAG: FAD-dependent oxidoreductase [Planctomycetota bacterium]
MLNFDLVVVGGGNAFRVAHEIAETGASVALIEPGPLGGTCPHRGCIPSKLLLAHAARARAVREAERYGVKATLESLDIERMLRETHDYTDPTEDKLRSKLSDNVRLFREPAMFVDAKRLRVGDETLVAERVVIAAGARPRRFESGPLAKLDAWTSDDVLRAASFPGSVAVVGAGPTGVELAAMFEGLGIATTLIQRGPRVLKNEDEDLTERLGAALAERLDLRLGTEVRAQSSANGRVRLELDDDSAVEVERVVLAVGRVPNTDSLGLETTDVRLGEHGHVIVDEYLETHQSGVFAMGDIIGRDPYTHAAQAEARYLVAHLRGTKHEPYVAGPVPRVTYVEPPLAAVGRTERELDAAKIDYRSALAPFSNVVAGHAARDEHGACKLIAKPSGELLGASILATESPSLIHVVSLAMQCNADVRTLASSMYAHPSVSELLRDAVRKLAGQLE